MENILGGRIRAFRGEKNLSQSDFGKLVGRTHQSVARWEKGLADVPMTIRQKIENILSGNDEAVSIDSEKLATLRKMDVGVVDYQGNTFIEIKDKFFMIIPLIEEYDRSAFIKGICESYCDIDFPVHLMEVPKPHGGDYFAFRVIGDHMENGTCSGINEGDVVSGRGVDKSLWKAKFHITKFKSYIIVHIHGILIRQIIGQDCENGTMTVHSLNDKYEDEILKLDDCLSIMSCVDVKRRG